MSPRFVVPTVRCGAAVRVPPQSPETSAVAGTVKPVSGDSVLDLLYCAAMGPDRSFRAVAVGGLAIDALTEAEVAAHVLAELRAARGGRLVTINMDIFRAASRDPDLKRLLLESSLRVADGMPLVWAAKLRGTPVPERVTGASLILSLTQAAAQEGRSVYLLGGPPGVAEQAGEALRGRYPSLTVAGVDATPDGV